MEIKIDFAELTQLQAQMAKAPEIVREELFTAVTEADLLLDREVIERTPKGASGGGASGLAGTMFHTEQVAGLGVEGFVGSSSSYVVPVDLGTKPHFPPINALMDWVKVKFGTSSEKEARGIAFAIAHKISRVGTKGAFMFERALQAVEPQLRTIFGEAQERIAARLGNT